MIAEPAYAEADPIIWMPAEQYRTARIAKREAWLGKWPMPYGFKEDGVLLKDLAVTRVWMKDIGRSGYDFWWEECSATDVADCVPLLPRRATKVRHGSPAHDAGGVPHVLACFSFGAGRTGRGMSGQYRAALDSPVGVMFMPFDSKGRNGAITTERIVELFAEHWHFAPSECELISVEETASGRQLWPTSVAREGQTP